MRVSFHSVKGRLTTHTHTHLIETRINGKSFSKLTPVHLDKLGVSFGSRIIIDELLEDIVSCNLNIDINCVHVHVREYVHVHVILQQVLLAKLLYSYPE